MAGQHIPRPGARQSILQAAIAHHQAGQLDQAERLYRKLLDRTPDHPDALHLLGVIAIARGRHERAIQLIGRALHIMPGFADAHVNLGNALRLAGKLEQAIESYQRAIALNPNAALAHSNLARVLNDLGRFPAALASCGAAIGLDPTLLAARVNLAVSLKGLGRAPDAVVAWRAAIALQPNRADSHHELGLLLGEMQRFDEAVKCHDAAIAMAPDNAVFHCTRGSAMLRMHDAAAAAESFRRAVILKPDFVEAWAELGWALRLIGRFDEAEASFQRVRELDPRHPGAYRHVAAPGAGADEPGELRRLADVLERPDSPVDQRIAAGFGSGRLLDSAGRFDEAFAHYATANALARQNWPPGGDRFDPANFARWVDLLIQTYPPGSLDGGDGYGDPSELPVFIVGMPRSGTTLVEQICASHSRVFGAGELHDIDRIATALGGGRSHDITARRGDAGIGRQLADAHIARLRGLGGDAVRVIDKMPDNILQVGLIATLFPRARIIYCRRDARDTALSCYFQLFSGGLMHFAYDLADCGWRNRETERLGAHWLRVLGQRMMELRYESLVADLEGESRRLIGFLGLDWEPACLEFHRTERTVTTASHWQVRQPLYSASVGRWRHYERHLGPLQATLGG